MPDLTPLPTNGVTPRETWEHGPLPHHVSRSNLAALTSNIIDDQPSTYGETLAVLIVHEGRIVQESYSAGHDEHSTFISWSMAKSMLQATVALLATDGLLDLHQPTGIAEWADDERSTITLDHLLRMRSGLRWREEYVDGDNSDVIEMLFGEGCADMAAFARSLPLAEPVGEVWNYSSGTTNIISGLCRDALGTTDVVDFLHDRLFGPLQMTSAIAKVDAAGTWTASSYVYATARDFARFGLCYLRGGRWGGEQLVPAAWVDLARTAHATDPETGYGYGHHWWTRQDSHDSFFMNGYEGQRVHLVPDLDLVIVRLGKTPAELAWSWRTQIDDIVDLFAAR